MALSRWQGWALTQLHLPEETGAPRAAAPGAHGLVYGSVSFGAMH